MIVKVHKFIGRILRWMVKDMCESYKKVAAYMIASFCALCAGFLYYECQQLLTQSKKDEIIRYVLSGDPANKAMIEKIDTLLSKRGVDTVYKEILK